MKRRYNTYIFFLSVFFVQILLYLVVPPYDNRFGLLLLGTMTLVVCIQFYFLLLQTLDDVRVDTELSILNEQKRLKDAQLSFLSDYQEDIQKVQTNMTKDLSHFQMLLNEEKYQEAADFLHKITDTSRQEHFQPCCRDSLLNAILESKHRAAARHHIDVTYEILLPNDMEQSRISQADLCSVIFNLMDNGIEACVKSGAEKPFITLTTVVRKGFLTIRMCNSKNPDTSFRHKTTKPDTLGHGFGLSIIEEICQRYDGVCQWNDCADHFDSVVLLRWS